MKPKRRLQPVVVIENKLQTVSKVVEDSATPEDDLDFFTDDSVSVETQEGQDENQPKKRRKSEKQIEPVQPVKDSDRELEYTFDEIRSLKNNKGGTLIDPFEGISKRSGEHKLYYKCPVCPVTHDLSNFPYLQTHTRKQHEGLLVWRKIVRWKEVKLSTNKRAVKTREVRYHAYHRNDAKKGKQKLINNLGRRAQY